MDKKIMKFKADKSKKQEIPTKYRVKGARKDGARILEVTPENGVHEGDTVHVRESPVRLAYFYGKSPG